MDGTVGESLHNGFVKVSSTENICEWTMVQT